MSAVRPRRRAQSKRVKPAPTASRLNKADAERVLELFKKHEVVSASVSAIDNATTLSIDIRKVPTATPHTIKLEGGEPAFREVLQILRVRLDAERDAIEHQLNRYNFSFTGGTS